MSSSDESARPAEPAEPRPADVLAWSHFRPRPAPTRPGPQSPAQELAAVLQHHRAELDAQRHRAASTVAALRRHLADQAVLVFHLGGVLARKADTLGRPELGDLRRQLSIAHDRMTAAVRAAGLTVEDPCGLPYPQVEHDVEVVGWRHDARFAAEVVAETTDPIVRHRDRTIRLGRIIAGAPPQPAARADQGQER